MLTEILPPLEMRIYIIPIIYLCFLIVKPIIQLTEILPPLTEILPPLTEILPPLTEILPPLTEILPPLAS